MIIGAILVAMAVGYGVFFAALAATGRIWLAVAVGWIAGVLAAILLVVGIALRRGPDARETPDAAEAERKRKPQPIDLS